jgi:hypothetical protein
MAIDLNDYGYPTNQQLWQEAQSAAATGLAKAQQVRTDPSESDLREKALTMAIEYHRSHGDVEGVEATAAKFLAFLKGGSDV